MHINRIARLTCLLFLFSSFSTPTYPMQFAKRFFKACTLTIHKGIDLAKRHPKLSTGIALGTTTILLIQKIKHRFIHKCAQYGRSLQYKFWHILGGRIDPTSPEIRRAFFRNVLNNKVWLTRQMLDDDIIINDKRVLQYDSTALHEATRLGHTQLATMLIERGADLTVQDYHNRTPLHIAAEHDRVEIVRALLARRAPLQEAPLQAQDIEGKTPLHTAAMFGRRAIAELLLDRGAAIEATTELHIPKTIDTKEQVRPLGRLHPLHLAAQKGDAAIIDLLIKRGADRTAVDATGKTPLQYAQLEWSIFAKKQPAIKLLEDLP